MREVEVKGRLSGISQHEARAVLEADGYRFGPEVAQHDTIYARSKRDVLDPTRRAPVVRLRSADGISTLTCKVTVGAELDCIELETRIEAPSAMHEILAALSFNEIVTVRKTRASASSGRLTVCVDSVDGLGIFVEVECVMSDGQETCQQTELESYIRTRFAGVVEIVSRGYDRLALERIDISQA